MLETFPETDYSKNFYILCQKILRRSWLLLTESIKTRYLAVLKKSKEFSPVFLIHLFLRFWHAIFSYLPENISQGLLNFYKLIKISALVMRISKKRKQKENSSIQGTEAATGWRCSIKKGILKSFKIFTGATCVGASFY